MHQILSTALAAALLAAAGTTQTTTFPLNPRSTFLRTNNDTPLAPLVIDLATLPAAPGNWLRITTIGAFRHVSPNERAATMDQDELLKKLGQLGRARDPTSDPRWEALSAGALSKEEAEALRRESEATEEGKRLHALFQPL